MRMLSITLILCLNIALPAAADDMVVLVSQHPALGTRVPQELIEQADRIDIVAPMWFGVTDAGDIEPLDGCDGPYAAYRDTATQHGVRLMPIVRNFAPQPMLGDPAAIDRFVDAAAELTVRESFDGLVVDFEHLKAASRRPLVDMATALYLKTRARGKTLCIAVAPKAWEGEYDYAALARQCDLLYVMTYDYAGPWSPAVGPTSPIHGPTRTHDIARDLDELAALDVPAHRTLLGVPFYGLDFTRKPGDAVDKHQHVETLYLNQIDNLRAAHDAKPRFDAQMQAASFIYHDGDGLAHVVWYDDAQSMAAKLDVVRQRGLGGIGAWSLRYDDLSVAGALWPLLPRRAPGVSASR